MTTEKHIHHDKCTVLMNRDIILIQMYQYISKL